MDTVGEPQGGTGRSLPVSTVRTTPDGIVTGWDAAAASRFGWTAESMIGRNLGDLATDQHHHADAWAELRRSGSWSGQVRRVTADGSVVLVHVRRVLRAAETGRPGEVEETGRDPNYLFFQMDPPLRDSEFRNRQLIRHMPTALWQVDSRMTLLAFEDFRAQGITDLAAHLDANPEIAEHSKDVVVVSDANLAAAALFRANGIADLLRPVRYLFEANPDMAKRVIVAAWEDRRTYVEETKMRLFDGSIRDVIFSVTYPLWEEAQDNTFIILEDITDRKNTEERLRKLQSDYSHAARISTLGQLATSIAHEVKQPLSAIITNAEIGLRWLEREDPSREKLVQLNTRIVESACHANDVIQRIRAMATKHEPTRSPLSVAEVLSDAIVFVRHDLETRSVALDFDKPADGPAILGDRVLLQQVFVNLLLNAVQAVVPLAIERRRIAISVGWPDAETVSILVEDDGPGIRPSDLPRLFDTYFTTKEGGLGMGLAISRSLVEAHDGTITAGNRASGGAVFDVRLPLSHSAQDGAHLRPW
jgi:PAS domain S-box-containing protein